MAEAPVAHTDEERRQRRRRLTILLVPIVALTAVGFVANAASPALIKNHPLVVIALNPVNRYLVLAAPRVEVWEFFAVGFFRMLLSDPLYFMLGRWYGEGALDWLETKTGNSGMVPFLKKWFGRAGPVIVFAAPNPYVCLLAGASRMNAGLFVALNMLGTLGRLVLIKAVGDVFEPVLTPVVNFVDRYRWQFVALSVVFISIQLISNRKKGASELESPAKMAEELEASIEAAEHES